MTKPNKNSWRCYGRQPKMDKADKKHYVKVFACPNCGNDDTDLLIRLRCSFYQCRLCNTEFDTELNYMGE